MKDSEYQRLLESSWRRPLTRDEELRLQALLAQKPELAGDWTMQLALTELLGQLPNAPVSSNFTARVLQEVNRQSDTTCAPKSGYWFANWRFRLLPRIALASVLLTAGILSYQHLQDSRRKDRAESVRQVLSYSSVPGPEVLQDYDVIRVMSQSPAADVELLKALQ